MQKRSSIKRPADINRLAASIVQDAIGEGGSITDLEGKNPAAVALGRKGGLKGGRARAEKLSAEERSEIAKTAAKARWQKKSNNA